MSTEKWVPPATVAPLSYPGREADFQKQGLLWQQHLHSGVTSILLLHQNESGVHFPDSSKMNGDGQLRVVTEATYYFLFFHVKE